MRIHTLFLLGVLSGAVVTSSCKCGTRPAQEVLTPEGQACTEDEQCETGLCDSIEGKPKVCLRKCTSGCRGSDVCEPLVPGRYACVPEKAGLCKTCSSDEDCPWAGDKCITLGAERFCGRDCSFDQTCPSSYRCAEATTMDGGRTPSQCQPSSGTCECIAATAGQQVPCESQNGFGRCIGNKTCSPPEGYTQCSARTPTAEVCNGEDDDCDGMTDEGLGDLTCGLGECARSASACANGVPQACTPGQPAAETCDLKDNDCDGLVDDGFDTMTDVNHCGGCNLPCALPHAVPKCVAGACDVTAASPAGATPTACRRTAASTPARPSTAAWRPATGWTTTAMG